MENGAAELQLRRFHCYERVVQAVAFPLAELSLIARHTFSGKNGKSRWVMPHGSKASSTALLAVGVAPIVAAAPIPFAPRGLMGVVVVVW